MFCWRRRTENKKALISLILLRASFMYNNGFEYTDAVVFVKNKLRHGGQYFKDYHSRNSSVDKYIYITYFYKSKAKNAR